MPYITHKIADGRYQEVLCGISCGDIRGSFDWDGVTCRRCLRLRDMPIGTLTMIPDFLPNYDELMSNASTHDESMSKNEKELNI